MRNVKYDELIPMAIRMTSKENESRIRRMKNLKRRYGLTQSEVVREVTAYRLDDEELLKFLGLIDEEGNKIKKN